MRAALKLKPESRQAKSNFTLETSESVSASVPFATAREIVLCVEIVQLPSACRPPI